MSATGLEVFDKTIHETNQFLKIVMRELETDDRHLAFGALRGALHALRDHLDTQSVAHLSAQMPMLLRGLFYEGWRPDGTLSHERRLADFLVHVDEHLPPKLKGSAEKSARAAFAALSECLGGNELAKVVHQMPRDLRGLWPEALASKAAS